MESLNKGVIYLAIFILAVQAGAGRHGTYTEPSDSRRQCTVHYTIPNENGRHILCRKTFSAVFALNNKQVQIVVEKKKTGNLAYTDGRGKSTKERKYNQEIRDQIIAHINTFPVEENHYCMKNLLSNI